jgi:anti-sigma factor RsiW
MRCNQAQQLFDAYLDGELSPSLAAELGAHQLQCARCRQALALMEVTGHILASEPGETSLSHDFANRLLACLKHPTARPLRRLQKWVYVGVPLAAAAMIALAVTGVFDRQTRVAGDTDYMPSPGVPVVDPATPETPGKSVAATPLPAERGTTQSGWDDPQVLTIPQLLDALQDAAEPADDTAAEPAAELASPAPAETEPPDDDIEDL